MAIHRDRIAVQAGRRWGQLLAVTRRRARRCLQALRQLVGHTIEEATADAAVALHVIFEAGARLTVEPDKAYEAWSVSGPDGALVVSTAGGKLAIWKSQLKADESAET
jgi:hypothetical protein